MRQRACGGRREVIGWIPASGSGAWPDGAKALAGGSELSKYVGRMAARDPV